MSRFNTEWKAVPYALLKEPYNLSPDVVMFYAYILDEYEYFSKNDTNGIGYTPAQSTLAKVMNTSERTIRRWLTVLRDISLVETKQRFDKSSIYYVRHFEPQTNQTDQQGIDTVPF